VTYRLYKLAPGSYDVILNGVIVASLVRTASLHHTTWTAELLVDLRLGERPQPFLEAEHEFASLEEACNWLGLSAEETSRATRQQDWP
jgi:hypothetical protein